MLVRGSVGLFLIACQHIFKACSSHDKINDSLAYAVYTYCDIAWSKAEPFGETLLAKSTIIKCQNNIDHDMALLSNSNIEVYCIVVRSYLFTNE